MQRDIYDYVPQENEGNAAFLEIVDGIPLGAYAEDKNLERQAKLTVIMHCAYEMSKKNVAYPTYLTTAEWYLHGANKAKSAHAAPVVCVCQAKQLLGVTIDIFESLKQSEKDDIQFVMETVHGYAKHMQGKVKEAGLALA